MRQHWNLNPEIDFLNHGSFGATPSVVLGAQRQWIDELERDPIRFLAPERELHPKLDAVRDRVADLVGTSADCLVFVRNATDGVNAVLRSFPFDVGDEVIVTDHGYNACNNAVRFSADRRGATTRVARVPFPIEEPSQVIDAIDREINSRTRLLVIDHVTSPTAIVFPIEQMIDLAHSRNVRVMIDGAHAPGMVPVRLDQFGADYYTANHHKWLCAPKASGFLYVDPRWHDEVRPTVISHGANPPNPNRSRLHSEFDWVGTYDPSPIFTVPSAIDFLQTLYRGGLDELMDANHRKAIQSQTILSSALRIDAPVHPSMIGSMVSVPLPSDLSKTRRHLTRLQACLYLDHRIEVPTFMATGETPVVRVSLQAYNSIEQVARLADLLPSLIERIESDESRTADRL